MEYQYAVTADNDPTPTLVSSDDQEKARGKARGVHNLRPALSHTLYEISNYVAQQDNLTSERLAELATKPDSGVLQVERMEARVFPNKAA